MKFNPIHLKKSWGRLLIVWGISTVVAFFFLGQEIFYASANERPLNLLHSITWQISYCYTWGLIMLLIFQVADRLRFNPRHWLRDLLGYTLLGIFAALVQRTLSLVMLLTVTAPEKLHYFFAPKFQYKIITGSFDSFIIYWLLLGIYYGIDYYQQFREHKIKTAQLEAQLAQAQLQALKMQLQPHFLFNTLHAISALMDENVDTAQRMLARLSELLRQTLEHIGVQEVTLRQEMDFLKNYLEIEETRFQERLTVAYRIDTDLLEACVPNLILQPLVENAIKHGIAPRATRGKITISARRAQDRLWLEIQDNGPGMPNKKNNIAEGLGLINTRKRLQQLYGADFRFELKSDAEQGFTVSLAIPLKFESRRPDTDGTD